jgi:hypothetical protein
MLRGVQADALSNKARSHYTCGKGLLFEHDLFRKPVSTFRDHALALADAPDGHIINIRDAIAP